MNEPPSPSGHATPDDPVEARIVAWVLGEASAFEAAELERLCEEKPELLVFRRRMRELHGLLTEAEASEPDDTWKLPAEKRKVLDEIFGREDGDALPIHVLDPLREKRISHSGRRAALTIAACVVVTFFVIRLVPSGYEAEATIEVKPRSVGVSPLGPDYENQEHVLSPQFFGTEFEKIKSSTSLGKVVDKLDLAARWGVDRQAAIQRVRASIRTENSEGTNLISIRVLEKTGQDAEEITAAVTQAYADYRRDLENRDADKALSELNKAIRDQEDKVEERRKVLATIVRTKGIIYRGQDSFYGQAGVDEDKSANNALETYTQLQQEKMQLEGAITSVEKNPQREDRLRQLEKMKEDGLGDRHPSVIATEDQLRTAKRDHDDRLGAFKGELQAKLDDVVERLKQVEDLKDNTREDAIKRGLDAQDYVDAKRDFETDQELLRQMRLKQLDRTIRGNTTDESVVIREAPKASKRGIDILGGSWFSSDGEEGGLASQSSEAKQQQAAAAAPAAPPSKVELQSEPSHLAQLEDRVRSKSSAKKEDEVRYKVEREDAARTRSIDLQATARQQQLAKNLPPADAPAPPPAEPQAMPGLAESSEMKPLPRVGQDMSIAGVASDSAAKDSSIARQPRGRVILSPSQSVADAPANVDQPLLPPLAESGAEADSFASASPPVELPSQSRAGMALGRSRSDAPDDIQIIREFDDASVDPNARPETASAGKAPSPATPATPRQFAQGAASVADGDAAPTDPGFDMVQRLESGNPPESKRPASIEDMRLGASQPSDPQLDQPSAGGGPGLRDLAQREVVRRQDEVAEGDALLQQGREAYAKGDYQQAVEKYRMARERLPDAPALSDKDQAYMAHLADASVALSMQHRKTGKYEEARDLLKGVLAADPDNAEAKRELGYLGDPIRANPALGDLNGENSDKVRRGLYTAEGNYNLGKYDDAKREYENTLKVDPSNDAARRGLEKVEIAKSDYYRAAYDHTRAELLNQVDAAWELSVPADEKPAGPNAAPTGEAAADSSHYLFRGSNLALMEEDKELLVKRAAELEKEIKGSADGAAKKAKFSDWQSINLELIRRAKLEKAEEKVEIIEETSASENPYSTFSLNISDASFQVARAAIEKGERPDPASIKPEQFYNAVDYGDPAPSAGEPVAATIEQSAHPVTPGRSLVRVAVRTGASGRSAAQPLRLTLLVDQSGSMVREDRRAAMDRALSQLSGLLTKADVVNVIGFSRTPHLLAEGMAGDQSAKLSSLVNQAASEGGTNLEEALKLGGQLAARHQLAGAQNRIVLFTDGAANLGDADPTRLAEEVKTLRQKGISFDIAGIAADDLNDRLLSELARNGNGRYYVVDDQKGVDFARQLAGAFRPAAENVKIQVIFNPRRVARYKLIGFEKDRLKTEDFRNDAVDAAELAAEETGTAIYQVEEIADGAGEIGELSVRFRDTASGEMVERSWTLPHATTATAFDRATPSLQLAGLSLLAAEKLRGGPLADAIDFNQLSGTIGSVKQYYGASSRAGDMLRLIDAIK